MHRKGLVVVNDVCTVPLRSEPPSGEERNEEIVL